eukprot:g60886.t1
MGGHSPTCENAWSIYDPKSPKKGLPIFQTFESASKLYSSSNEEQEEVKPKNYDSESTAEPQRKKQKVGKDRRNSSRAAKSTYFTILDSSDIFSCYSAIRFGGDIPSELIRRTTP